MKERAPYRARWLRSLAHPRRRLCFRASSTCVLPVARLQSWAYRQRSRWRPPKPLRDPPRVWRPRGCSPRWVSAPRPRRRAHRFWATSRPLQPLTEPFLPGSAHHSPRPAHHSPRHPRRSRPRQWRSRPQSKHRCTLPCRRPRADQVSRTCWCGRCSDCEHSAVNRARRDPAPRRPRVRHPPWACRRPCSASSAVALRHRRRRCPSDAATAAYRLCASPPHRAPTRRLRGTAALNRQGRLGTANR